MVFLFVCVPSTFRDSDLPDRIRCMAEAIERLYREKMAVSCIPDTCVL